MSNPAFSLSGRIVLSNVVSADVSASRSLGQSA